MHPVRGICDTMDPRGLCPAAVLSETSCQPVDGFAAPGQATDDLHFYINRASINFTNNPHNRIQQPPPHAAAGVPAPGSLATSVPVPPAVNNAHGVFVRIITRLLCLSQAPLTVLSAVQCLSRAPTPPLCAPRHRLIRLSARKPLGQYNRSPRGIPGFPPGARLLYPHTWHTPVGWETALFPTATNALFQGVCRPVTGPVPTQCLPVACGH